MQFRFFMGYFILIVFAFIGFTFTSNLLHELSHRNDFKDVSDNVEVCLLSLGDAIAYYDFNYDIKDAAKVSEIKKTTEYRAYGIEFALFLILLMAIMFVLYDLKVNRSSYAKLY